MDFIDTLTQIVLDYNMMPEVRVKALEQGLTLFKEKFAYPLLIIMFRRWDEHWVQLAAKEGLQSIKSLFPPRIKGLLEELLYEGEYEPLPKRAVSASLLGRLHYTQAAPNLIVTFIDKNENKYIRGASAEALGEMQYKNASPTLLKILSDESEVTRVRCSAAVGLGWMHAEEAVPTLLHMLQHPDHELWLAAANAIINFPDDSITNTLIDQYFQFTADGNMTRAHRIREVLSDRNLVPFLENSRSSAREFLLELIQNQTGLNLQNLEKIKEQTPQLDLKLHLEHLIPHLQPKIQNKSGFELVL